MFYPEPKPAPCIHQQWDNELNEYVCACPYELGVEICNQESLTSCIGYIPEERNTEPLED